MPDPGGSIHDVKERGAKTPVPRTSQGADDRHPSRAGNEPNGKACQSAGENSAAAFGDHA
jgi:hypothetical protein